MRDGLALLQPADFALAEAGDVGLAKSMLGAKALDGVRVAAISARTVARQVQVRRSGTTEPRTHQHPRTTCRPRHAERRYTPLVSTAHDIYRELLELPEQERLRLVERVIHDLVDAAKRRAASASVPAGPSVIGLWADEPEVVDQMIEGALRERETRGLRTTDDASLDG